MRDEPTDQKPPSIDEKLERLLTRDRTARFQLWQALLAGLLAVAGTILFGALAVRGATDRGSGLEKAARAIAEAPLAAWTIVRQAATGDKVRLAFEQRFEGESGFKSMGPGAAPPGAMLLLSRYDGKRGVVELVDLATGAVEHQWRPDMTRINKLSRMEPEVVNLARDFHTGRYIPFSPIAEPDGSIVFHGMHSPLVKIDACGEPVWTVDGLFHHGLERDADGAYWVADQTTPPSIRRVGRDFQDDAVVKVSPDGEVLFRKSVAQMLIDAGAGYVVYSRDAYDPDPIHLNDVEPALEGGPNWRKGDLFLSLRNPSMIALYRPSTDKLVWTKQGPWLMQHDVDVLNDREIAVFDNNTMIVPGGERVDGVNDYVVYDVEADQARSPYRSGFERHDVRTNNNGLAERLEDGSLMVEEQNFGRLVAFDAAGATRWTYVNRGADGRIYHLGWSRALSAATAARLKEGLAKARCPQAAD